MNKQQIAEALLTIAKNNLDYLEPGMDLEDEENEDLWVPVRLRCHRENFDAGLRALPSNHYYSEGNVNPDNGSIQILSGDSQYDTDHRGWWGTGCIHVTADIDAAMEVAAELMDEVEESISQELFSEKAKTVKEVKASYKPTQFGIAPLYAWEEAETWTYLCFVSGKDGDWWFPSVSGLIY